MFTQALGTTTTGFEGQFRFLSDTQGLGTAVGRHPSADLLPIFNAAYRSLVSLVTTYGYTQFCRRGSTLTLPTSPIEAGETYATIDVGTSGAPGTVPLIQQIKAMDVKYTSGKWARLEECTLLQLRDYAFDSTPGVPRAWCWLDSGRVAATTFTKGSIAVTPVPNGGSYALWQLDEPADLSATTDLFYYHTEDWRKWHMYSAMSQIVGARDKDTAHKLDWIMRQLNPDVEGTPAYLIREEAPTASGSRTWTRSSNYRSGGWR